jgi:hypothetical protein
VFQDGSDRWPTLTPRSTSLGLPDKPDRGLERCASKPPRFIQPSSPTTEQSGRLPDRRNDKSPPRWDTPRMRPATLVSFRVSSALDARQREMHPPARTKDTPQRSVHLRILALTSELNLANRHRLYPFPSKRFHALLNSLFKVLCNFPSRYLFAIGLAVIFSLR